MIPEEIYITLTYRLRNGSLMECNAYMFYRVLRQFYDIPNVDLIRAPINPVFSSFCLFRILLFPISIRIILFLWHRSARF